MKKLTIVNVNGVTIITNIDADPDGKVRVDPVAAAKVAGIEPGSCFSILSNGNYRSFGKPSLL